MKAETLSRLDSKIQEILNDSSKTDSEKAVEYNRAAAKYTEVFNKITSPPLPLPAKEDSETATEEVPSNEYRGLSLAEIDLNSAKEKVKQFLDHLERDGNVKWDDRGQILFKDSSTPYAGSNVVRLAEDAVRKYDRRPEPAGAQLFYRLLRKSTVPHHLVKNKERRKLLIVKDAPTPSQLQTPKRRLFHQAWENLPSQ